MKNLSAIFMLIATLFLFNCTSTEDSQSCDSEGDCLWAEIDGSDYTAQETAGAYFDLGVLRSANFTGLGDVTSTTKDNIAIFISNPEVGTINYSGDNTLTYSDSDENQYFAEVGSGSIEITTFDTSTREIEGTFTATLLNADDNSITLSLTDGYFKVVLN